MTTAKTKTTKPAVKKTAAKKAPAKAVAKPKHVFVTNSALQARKEKTHRAQIERTIRRYKEDLRKWRKVAAERPDMDRYSRISHVKCNTLDTALSNIADQLEIIDELRKLKPCTRGELWTRAAALVATPR